MKNFDDLLNPYYIRDFLSLESKLLVPVIQVYEHTESTNNILLEKNCIYPNGHACFAENQTNGRGMHDKKWVSSKNNICFSVSWNYDKPLEKAHMLNYAIAVQVVKNLNDNGFKDIKLKWPNDLIFNNAKLGGILIDLVSKKNKKIYLVAGLGLNLEVSKNDNNKINQKISDLKSTNINTKIMEKNKIAAILLDAIIKCLSKFEKYDYKNLSEEWNTMDYNYNNIKKILVNNKEISAKLMGINESGQLNCFHGEKIHAYNINEVQIIKDELLCD
tara:strand:+ start:1867 stop:2688 length:822 start_codon:yes stop_codon:yes gene_type:complete